MDPLAIKPIAPGAVEPRAPAEGVAPKRGGFVLCPDLGADPQPRRGPRDRGLLGPTDAAAEAMPSDERMVVQFEPVAIGEGQVLAVAHVVRAHLSDLCEQAEAARQSRAHRPLPEAHARIDVELQADDCHNGRALIQVHDSALGPMQLELRLCRGQLFVHATVSNARAAEALTSDQALLERALRLSGLELGSLSVEITRRRGEPKRVTPVRGSGSGERQDKEG